MILLLHPVKFVCMARRKKRTNQPCFIIIEDIVLYPIVLATCNLPMLILTAFIVLATVPQHVMYKMATSLPWCGIHVVAWRLIKIKSSPKNLLCNSWDSTHCVDKFLPLKYSFARTRRLHLSTFTTKKIRWGGVLEEGFIFKAIIMRNYITQYTKSIKKNQYKREDDYETLHSFWNVRHCNCTSQYQ